MCLSTVCILSSLFGVFDRRPVLFCLKILLWETGYRLGKHKISDQTGLSNHLSFMLLPTLGKSLSFSQPHFTIHQMDTITPASSCWLKGSKEIMVTVVKDELMYFKKNRQRWLF